MDISQQRTTKQLASAALHRAQSNTTQAEATPSVQLRYVATGGSDTTGKGSFAKPFATIQAAINSITNAGPLRHEAVLVSPGTYAGDFELKPFVTVDGLVTSNPPNITGNVAVAAGFLDGAMTGLANLELGQNTTLDFGSASGVKCRLNRVNSQGNSLALVGAGTLGNIYNLVNSKLTDASVTAAASLDTTGSSFSGTTTVRATSNDLTWKGRGDVISGTLHLIADPTFHLTTTDFAGTTATPDGHLMLDGMGVTYDTPVSAIPLDVALLNGATPPVKTAPAQRGYDLFAPNDHLSPFPLINNASYVINVSVNGIVTNPGSSGGAVGDTFGQVYQILARLIGGIFTIVGQNKTLDHADASLSTVAVTIQPSGSDLGIKVDMSGSAAGLSAHWTVSTNPLIR